MSGLSRCIIPPEELAAIRPEQILPCTPSTASALSKVSEEGQSDLDNRRFQEIGKGQCGTVYSLLDTSKVAKVSNAPEKVRELLIDYKAHTQVLEAMRSAGNTLKMEINIPQLHSWTSLTSQTFRAQTGLQFPTKVDAKSFALVSERIFPIPTPVCEAMVDVLCPPAIWKHKQQFLAKSENKNCLIRLYLGRRETTKSKAHIQNFKLQNFPLHVNEMESLQLDTVAYANIMAQTLAILHWKAGLDGNDIEFILGSSPKRARIPTAEEACALDEWGLADHFELQFGNRSINMWLIDFNQFEDNAAGLEKLVNAFIWNDPYYPRPNSDNTKDKELWAAFRERYLQVSRMFTDSAMPARFVAEIEARTKKGTVGGLFGN